MPKIELSALKGLKQSAGQGFCDADVQIHAALDLSAATATAAQKGAVVHLLGNGILTLPKSTQGAVKGQIKIIISTHAGADVHAYANDAENAAVSIADLDSPKDLAICVFNGTTWVAGLSTT